LRPVVDHCHGRRPTTKEKDEMEKKKRKKKLKTQIKKKKKKRKRKHKCVGEKKQCGRSYGKCFPLLKRGNHFP